MRRLVALSLCACTPVVEDTEAPSAADPAGPASVVAIPHERGNALADGELDPVDIPPEIDTVFACAGAVQHVAKHHSANLELRKDGTFELHFSDVSDEGGQSLWMLGKWDAEQKSISLHPESGLQRRWSGDAHRHAHGEESGYSLDHEGGVYTHERRLPLTATDGRITAIRIDEIGTSVYPKRGDTVERCDPSPMNP